MKRCTRCKKQKKRSAFAKKKGGKGGLSAHCRTCQKKYWEAYYENVENRTRHIKRAMSFNQARRERIRLVVQGLKCISCTDCGHEYPYYVMQFDHRPKVRKLGTISQMMQRGAAEAALMREIKKCDVVCANCHAVRTYQRVMRKLLRRASSTGKLQEQS